MKKLVLLMLLIVCSVLGDDSVTSQVVLTTTQTLVTQLSDLIITGIFAVITYYIKEFLQTSSFVKKYNLDNEKTERLLANAISYAETSTKRQADAAITKRDMAVKYLEKVSPDTINKYGEVIHDMLDRKVEQLKVDQKIRNNVAA